MTRRVPTACAVVACAPAVVPPPESRCTGTVSRFRCLCRQVASGVEGAWVCRSRIVRNDSVIYHKGFGTLANGGRTPVTDETLFEIGSESSKAFTATLVAMMVSDGKMKYDDLISKYLPDFKLYDPAASAPSHHSRRRPRPPERHRARRARLARRWWHPR